MGLIYTGTEHYRTPPEDAQRELQEAYPELFYEWLPRAKRWAVKRRVPWEDVDRLAREGQIHQADIDAHREQRRAEGHMDDGDALVVHAFTVQGPDGEYLEPGGYVIEALRRADTHRHPGGVRGALREVLQKEKEREAQLDKWYRDQIEQAVEYFDPWLRQNPRSPSWQIKNNVPFGRDAQTKGESDA